jgi:hypothetical protein
MRQREAETIEAVTLFFARESQRVQLSLPSRDLIVTRANISGVTAPWDQLGNIPAQHRSDTRAGENVARPAMVVVAPMTDVTALV